MCGAKPLSNWIGEDVIVFFGEVRVVDERGVRKLSVLYGGQRYDPDHVGHADERTGLEYYREQRNYYVAVG